jgi:hypothetical protein
VVECMNNVCRNTVYWTEVSYFVNLIPTFNFWINDSKVFTRDKRVHRGY